MRVKGISVEQLNLALKTVNDTHDYKLIYNREPEKSGRFLNFTIRSEKSRIAGASISHSGRNSVAASWHAHGYLFDEIFNIDPDAIIKSRNNTITKDDGNWVDFNIGSMMCPMYASEGSIL